MYADTGGDGPVVVLLHGVLMNGSLWSETVEHLRDGYRIIVPELPLGGHRRPMPDAADLTLPAMAKLIAEFLAELDLKNVTLVSNDWGGAQLAIWPGGSERVANLVLAPPIPDWRPRFAPVPTYPAPCRSCDGSAAPSPTGC